MSSEPDRLSGDEISTCNSARALRRDPAVFLEDSDTIAFDAEAEDEIAQKIRSIWSAMTVPSDFH